MQTVLRFYVFESLLFPKFCCVDWIFGTQDPRNLCALLVVHKDFQEIELQNNCFITQSSNIAHAFIPTGIAQFGDLVMAEDKGHVPSSSGSLM